MNVWRENPLIRRELLYRLRPQPSQRSAIMVVVILCLVAVLSFYWLLLEAARNGVSGSELLAIVGVAQVLVVCVGAPAATANAVSREREQRTWDLLTVTMLKPHEVVLGKLMGRMLPLLSIVVLGLPVMIMAVFLDSRLWLGAVMVIGTVLFTLLLYSSAGLAASCFSRKTVTATALAYLFVGVWVFGTLILLGVGQLLLPWSARDWLNLWLTVNPFAVVVMTVNRFGSGGSFARNIPLEEVLSPWTLWIVYAVFTVAVIRLMIVTYRRWAYR